MSDDIVEFLRERLAEDEEAARAADAGPWEVGDEEGYCGDDWSILGELVENSRYDRDTDSFVTYRAPAAVASGGYEGGGVWRRENAAHIARHDPARVLREVEAKRRIVELAADARSYQLAAESEFGPTNDPSIEDAILIALAAVYSDHPDYRQEWSL